MAEPEPESESDAGLITYSTGFAHHPITYATSHPAFYSAGWAAPYAAAYGYAGFPFATYAAGHVIAKRDAEPYYGYGYRGYYGRRGYNGYGRRYGYYGGRRGYYGYRW